MIGEETDRYIGPPILSTDIWPFEYRPIYEFPWIMNIGRKRQNSLVESKKIAWIFFTCTNMTKLHTNFGTLIRILAKLKNFSGKSSLSLKPPSLLRQWNNAKVLTQFPKNWGIVRFRKMLRWGLVKSPLRTWISNCSTPHLSRLNRPSQRWQCESHNIWWNYSPMAATPGRNIVKPT